MKKLISIGVALALLTVVIVPGAVAAQPPSCPESDYTYPTTYAKIPFAILESGFQLLETLWPDLDPALGIGMLWVGPVLGELGAWAGGPLGWTVDMLGWGLGVVAGIVDALGPTLGLPDYVGTLLNEVVCSIFTPFDCVVGPAWDPCEGVGG